MRTDGSAGFSPDLGAALGDMQDLAAGFRAELEAATGQMREMDGETQRLARSLGSSLRSALDKAIFGGGKLSDVFKGLARDVAGRAFDAALRPVQNAIGGGLASLTGSLTGSLAGALGFAKGGAFTSGNVRAFASGGIVSSPTLFPMRNGTGLMGEAGPEAIMPLRRGADGRLGVAAAGGGGGTKVVVNISTPDLAGFERSRGQVAAQLARAVQRGSTRL
ncbi:MAG: phage tail tape measure protein [Pseudomonadota bacterium]